MDTSKKNNGWKVNGLNCSVTILYKTGILFTYCLYMHDIGFLSICIALSVLRASLFDFKGFSIFCKVSKSTSSDL